MDFIEKYFLKHTKQLAYLELKREAAADALAMLEELPLPICLFDFTDGLSGHRFDHTLDLELVIKGMIYNIGIDPDFMHVAAYRNFLESRGLDGAGLAVGLAIEAMREAGSTMAPSDDTSDALDAIPAITPEEKAIIALRAATVLAPQELMIRARYAQLLWQLPHGEETSKFVAEASRLLESVLHEDEGHAYANMALGEMNERMGQYLKATAYYRRALASSSDEESAQQIRDRMQSIAADAGVENAIYYIRRADYRRAVEALMPVKAQSNRYDVDYYLGVAYENIANYEAATSAFESALEKGADFEALYNDLVFSLNAQGALIKAKRYADEGLEHHPAALKLRYNRAIVLSQLGKAEDAVSDCDFILEYHDLSDELFNQTMLLREQLMSRQG